MFLSSTQTIYHLLPVTKETDLQMRQVTLFSKIFEGLVPKIVSPDTYLHKYKMKLIQIKDVNNSRK